MIEKAILEKYDGTKIELIPNLMPKENENEEGARFYFTDDEDKVVELGAIKSMTYQGVTYTTCIVEDRPFVRLPKSYFN